MLFRSIPVLVLSACNLGAPVELDGSSRLDGDVDASSDAPADAEAGPEGDASVLTGPGPVTHVVADISLSTERHCDLDGDGLEDNAIADLGEPSATHFAAAVGIGLLGAYDAGARQLLHFSWIADRATPSDTDTTLFVLGGIDLDVPTAPEDDLSGAEPFWVAAEFLDGCGEPREHFPSVTISDGVISTSSRVAIQTTVGGGLILSDAHVEGTAVTGFRSAEWDLCGHASIFHLGDSLFPVFSGGLTILEVLTAGGRVFGVPTLPGLSPDVDVDGDGLERLNVDDDGRLVSCVDGDSTEIPGRDCWRDSRMADGVSMNFHLVTATAECVGPEPGWRQILGESCEEGPPEESLWQGSCGCEGRYSAMSDELLLALSSAESEGAETGEAIPLVDTAARIVVLPGDVALEGAGAETLEWAGDPTRCVLVGFDINAEGDETPFEPGDDWLEAGLLIRGAAGGGSGPFWVRMEPSTTLADVNLVDSEEGVVELDYGGPSDDDIAPNLVPAVERAKEVVLETLRGCRLPEE